MDLDHCEFYIRIFERDLATKIIEIRGLSIEKLFVINSRESISCLPKILKDK